nr:MAG TPA: hypothetical protein [Caudoviricetes sp.]
MLRYQLLHVLRLNLRAICHAYIIFVVRSFTVSLT